MRWVVRGGRSSHEVEVERRGDEFSVEMDGQRHELELVSLDGAVASLRFPATGRSLQITYHHGSNGSWRVTVGQREFDLEVLTPAEAVEAVSAARDSALIVLEAMKMENELAADQAGKVAAIHVAAGDTVEGRERWPRSMLPRETRSRAVSCWLSWSERK